MLNSVKFQEHHQYCNNISVHYRKCHSIFCYWPDI